MLATNGSGGTYPVQLFGAEIQAAAGSGGSGLNQLTGDVTAGPGTGSQASTIAANAVTSAKMALVNTRRTCAIVIGAENGAALGTADIAPQGRQCYIPAAATVVEIDVAADGGTPAVVVARNHAGTLTISARLSRRLLRAGWLAPTRRGQVTESMALPLAAYRSPLLLSLLETGWRRIRRLRRRLPSVCRSTSLTR